jgi:hypothetical protein
VWQVIPGSERSIVTARFDRLVANLLVEREFRCAAPPSVVWRPPVACHRQPVREAWIALHGERGKTGVRTDGDGRASLDMTLLPADQFPYRGGIVAVACRDCEPAALRVPERVSAELVKQRRRLDDFDAWFVVHEGSPLGYEMAVARAAEQQRQRAAQDAAAAAAEPSLLRNAFGEAMAALRPCWQQELPPSPNCVATEAAIQERFVEQQLRDARIALESFRFDDADEALYRCELIDRRAGSSCRWLRGQFPLYRLLAAWHEARTAYLAGKSDAAREALDRCLGIDPHHVPCSEMRDRMASQASRHRTVPHSNRSRRQSARR